MSSNPDLSSVLRTLSAFANPASNAAPGPTPAPTPAPVTANHKDNDDNYNTTYHKHQQQQQQQQQQRDSSNIKTWPSALKHIMHLVSTNRTFSAQIQRLIKSQHDHERQWWAGREALIAKQKTREEKKKRLEEVLKSVGAPIQAANVAHGGGSKDSKEGVSPAQENATELLAYDTKVHQASIDMSRAMETELRRLGVPFFCLGVSTSSTSTSTSTSTASSSSLSKDELDALKKRVLDLLVDLCT